MIDGEGQSYTVSDAWTDYYGSARTTVTDVTTKILINDSGYYISPLHKRMDRTVGIDKYSLKEMPAGYADRANISDYSDTANLARRTDFGRYLPKDCTADVSCDTVAWVKNLLYSLRSLTADSADTATCPTGDINSGIADTQGNNTFILLLSQAIPGQLYLCNHDQNFIYHAQTTPSNVREAVWLAPGGDYTGVLTVTTATQAQRTRYADTSTFFSTHNDVTGLEEDGTIEHAGASKNAKDITTEYMNYTGGNGTKVNINIK